MRYAAMRGESRRIDATEAEGSPPTGELHCTGMGSAESSIAIDRSGTLFFAPAFTNAGNGVARSRDRGASWELLRPELPDGRGHGRSQPYLYLDPVTDRLFFHTSTLRLGVAADPGRHGFDLTWSADGGDTWSYTNVAPDAHDWGKVCAGPAVTSSPQGYPRALYFTAPSPLSTPIGAIIPREQVVYRSLDGGEQFDRVGTISLDPAKYFADQPHEWVIFGTGVVAPDGRIYLGLRLCSQLGIAVSGDEGHSWIVKPVPDARVAPFDTRNLATIIANPNVLLGELMAVDVAGNLYAVWVGEDHRVQLSVSRDGAHTWASPVVISAPDLCAVRYSAVAARAPGHIAIAYYGSSDGRRFDGYIAESTDALSTPPRFWSVRVNEAADPLFPDGFEPGYAGIFQGADLVEFVQVRFAPDGDVWASFVKDMRGAPAEAWSFEAQARSRFQGVAGRLTRRR